MHRKLEKRVRWYRGYQSGSWRVDETYVRVGGTWKYLFCAVDKRGELIDRRDACAAYRFLSKALEGYAELATVLHHHR